MDNLTFVTVKEDPAFDTFKIKKLNTGEITISAVFKVKKINKQIIENLNDTLKKYNNEASSMFLDISIIDSIAANVLEYNVDMIKNLENGSTIKRVGICAGKFTTFAFKALMKLKKPKVETKVFDKEELALNFAINGIIETKK